MTTKLAVADLPAYRLCFDNDDTAIPMADGTSAGSVAFPRLRREGLPDVYEE